MNRSALELSGMLFEQHVATELLMKFPGSRVLHNLNLYSYWLSFWKNRSTITQIDLIFITQFKIYIIEAKRWGTEIIGTRDDQIWQGKSNAGSFLENENPVQQNLIHFRELRNLLRRNGYTDLPCMESLVCVPNGTHVKTECKEVMELSHISTKLMYDHMMFLEGRGCVKTPLDVKYWDNAISEVLRIDAKAHRV